MLPLHTVHFLQIKESDFLLLITTIRNVEFAEHQSWQTSMFLNQKQETDECCSVKEEVLFKS